MLGPGTAAEAGPGAELLPLDTAPLGLSFHGDGCSEANTKQLTITRN